MGLGVQRNIAAANAYRHLSVNDGRAGRALERLSSGVRVNRAADDAAGLVVSEGLRARIGGTKVALRNVQDGISLVQTAEGALTETHAVLQRMRELAVQAANGGAQDPAAQRAADQEFRALKGEIDRIAVATGFGSQKPLKGDEVPIVRHRATTDTDWTGGRRIGATDLSNTLRFTVDGEPHSLVLRGDPDRRYTPEEFRGLAQAAIDREFGVGRSPIELTLATSGSRASFSLVSDTGLNFTYVGSGLMFLTSGATNSSFTDHYSVPHTATFQVGADPTDRVDVALGPADTDTLRLTDTSLAGTVHAQQAIGAVDTAIKMVSAQRGDLGAAQNRLEHTLNRLSTTVENLSASESRIRDTDMAAEMASLTRHQVLSQTGIAMLAQAGQAPQSILKLLS